MDPRVLELEKELKDLTKGRGLWAVDIEERPGPALRRIFGIEGDDLPARVRRKLKDHLRELVEDLPRDLRVAASAAFALDDHQRDPTLAERLGRIQSDLDREFKTVGRRVNDGIRLIAQNAVQAELERKPPPSPPAPWRTAELRCSVVLDLPVPEVIETRRIVANQDDLKAVELSVTVEPAPGSTGRGSLHDLGLDVLYGGALTERVMKSSKRVGFVLELPYPLGRHKEHEYAFRLRLPAGTPMAPYYVCTPTYSCTLFKLHVRFGSKVPESIWRVHETKPWDICDSWENRKPVSADPCGEVYAEFFDLELRSSYGLVWSHEVSPGRVAGGRTPS